ncbi:DNA ligase 1-like isoform X4 [Coffea arabica]|uniref:DNA ligase n=1 Tax=Coffea arabica TaxID=13443 RepID=A0ABM4WLJ8_COFAR
MFTAFRSCSSSLHFTHHTLSLHPLRKPLGFKPYFLVYSSFPAKPFSQRSLFLLIPLVNPGSIAAMASRPSAFDLLMSNASKKKSEQKQQKPSPKKRKTTTPTITSQNSAPISVKEPDSAQIKEAQLEKDMKNDDSSNFKDAQLGKSEEAVVKKPKVVITPDESLLELKDKATSFDPKKAAYWGKGQRVPFMFVAKALDAISKESGRIAITAIVCNMLRTVMETTPEDLVAVVYLLANRIAPAHEGLELGIGDASIIKALSEACGTKEAQIKKQYKESGKDSQEKKKNHIKALLVAATDCEPQYLIRLLQAAKIVKQVYSVIPVYDKIIPALLADGVWDLPKTCSFSPGVPVGPMLAKPTKGVSEILDKFQDIEFTCEYKYDGERAQIHYMEDGTVEIYSRNAERNTGKYPDVVDAISRFKRPSVTSFVLDCEIVAFDREKKKILPFQVLSTRARKNVVLSEIKVGVCIYAFDILYINGQPLLQAQLDSRRQHLYESFEEGPGFFQFATAVTSNDLEEIQKFLEAAVDASCEGLIIKTLKKDATYEPSKRSNNWLKLKKDYMDSTGDSLDLVPIAAFHGRGKRTGVYGAFLLACYDVNNEEFQSICKIGTGFSEAVLEERSASLRSKVIPKPKSYYRYSDTINPDVWFEPIEVWEVKAADLTISPVHRAATGIVDSDKGISLRFPRLLRVREDKNPEDASSADMVADMYRAQKHNQSNRDDDEQ